MNMYARFFLIDQVAGTGRWWQERTIYLLPFHLRDACLRLFMIEVTLFSLYKILS